MTLKFIILTSVLLLAATSQSKLPEADLLRMRGYLVQLIGQQGIGKFLEFFYFDIKGNETCGIGMVNNCKQMKKKYKDVDQWTRELIVKYSLIQIIPYLQDYVDDCRKYIQNFDQHPNYIQEIILDIYYQNGAKGANTAFKNTLNFIRDKQYEIAGMYLRQIATRNTHRNFRRAQKLMMGENSHANKYYRFQVTDKNTSIQQIDQNIIDAGIIL